MSKIRIFTGFICFLLFAVFSVTALSVFEWSPWNSLADISPLVMVYIWIPECIICVIHVILLFFTKKIFRARIILVCLNAVYIPAYYTIGLTSLSGKSFLEGIAICSAVTTVLFGFMHIFSIIKKIV